MYAGGLRKEHSPRADKSLHSEAHLALCAMLKQARLKAGLKQQELAKQLKRPQSFVAKVESGERRLDVVQFVLYVAELKQEPIAFLRTYSKSASASLAALKRAR